VPTFAIPNAPPNPNPTLTPKTQPSPTQRTPTTPTPANPQPSNLFPDGDSYIVVASDGLFAEEARGGGGGLDNATVAELCGAAAGTSCDALAQTLSTTAQKVGSTDDVTVVVLRLK
jgi:serine/threonine protein phosphatase PrpC